MQLQVALTLHGFTLYVPHFMRGLCLCQMNSHYVMHYTFSSLYTIKRQSEYSIKVLCFTLHLEKQKSRKVRASLLILKFNVYKFSNSRKLFQQFDDCLHFRYISQDCISCEFYLDSETVYLKIISLNLSNAFGMSSRGMSDSSYHTRQSLTKKNIFTMTQNHL